MHKDSTSQESNLEAAQCFCEIDFELHKEILAAALKDGVILLLQDKDDISRLNARLLIAFASEGDFLIMTHALVNVHLSKNQHLSNGNTNKHKPRESCVPLQLSCRCRFCSDPQG